MNLSISILDTLEDTKLLGIIILSDLTWHKNTKMLVNKAYKRIIILKKLYEFNVPTKDLVKIYVLFIRSILEQSCVVWHSSITQEEVSDLERVQKVCLRIIMKEKYDSYEKALEETKLELLSTRRTCLCLNFAKSSLKQDIAKHMFPLNESDLSTRHRETFKVQPASTSRLAKSALPYLQRLLNDEHSTH